MQHKTPQARLEQFVNLMERVVMPLMPHAQQSGMVPNLEKVMSLVASESDIEEFAEIFGDGTGLEMLQQVSGDYRREIDSDKPPLTKRVYERVNRPAGTKQGRDKAMSMAMMGKQVQPDEQASMMRGDS